MLTGLEAGPGTGGPIPASGMGGLAGKGRVAGPIGAGGLAGQGESVIRVRPAARLFRVLHGGLHLGRQRRELMAAPLADHGERLPVAHEPQGDVVDDARTVTARDGRNAKQRAVYAA